jgi:hypothetical protein
MPRETMEIEIECYFCGKILKGEMPLMCTGEVEYLECTCHYGVQIFAYGPNKISIDKFRPVAKKLTNPET